MLIDEAGIFSVEIRDTRVNRSLGACSLSLEARHVSLASSPLPVPPRGIWIRVQSVVKLQRKRKNLHRTTC